MKISLIVAVAENGVIGQGGRLPWRLPADLQHFKRITLGKPVLMGRKTWASIGQPLPGRRNLVVTRDPNFTAPGAEVYADLDAALRAVADAPELMVIGGADVYRALLPRAQTLHLTRVHARPEGDTAFPALTADWVRVSSEFRPADEQNRLDLDFEVWKRS
jgi:dihydrofolate reductase